MRGKGSEEIRTVAVTIVRCHFLPDRDWLDHAKGNVATFTKELAIVVTIVLS
jgi:hypothetical protein